jgi:hypothetical protein
VTKVSAVDVPLADGTTESLSRERLFNAARTIEPMPAEEHDRAEVTWAGTRYDALELVAHALGVGEDLVRPRAALRALAELDPDAESGGGEIATHGSKEPPEEYNEPTGDETEVTAGELSDDLTPDVFRRLQRWPGMWVAIRGGQVIEADEALNPLLERLEDSSATVMYVPTKSERSHG